MTSRPHDAFFKDVFSDLDNARGELASMLPPAVSALIEWSTLKLEPGSFVDDALRETMTDLLFSVQMRGREARLYVLFEHQSSAHPLMPFRVLAYVVRIWDAWLRDHPGARRLPPIVPVLLAQVEGGWSAPTELLAVIDFADDAERDALAGLVPSCKVLVDDLAHVTNAMLGARDMPDAARLALAALRDVRDASDLASVLATWAPWIRSVSHAQGGEDTLYTLMRYILEAGDRADPAEIVSTIREIDEQGGDMVMSMAERLIERGRVEGEARGAAKGKAEGKAEGRAEMLLKLLPLRFPRVPDDVAERIRAADSETLDRWADGVSTATSLDELLRR